MIVATPPAAPPAPPTTPSSPPPSSAPASLPGFNILLQGDAGVGKTHSIHTLVDSGMEVFYLACEPGMESLIGYYSDAGRPVPSNLHWHYLAPPKANIQTLIDGATKVNTMSFEMLTKMTDPNRSQHNYFVQFLGVLNDFVDQRTGEHFGPVDSWGTDRVLVVDPLTGLNRAVMSLVVGSKPVKSPADWGVAQDQIERLLHYLTDSCRTNFILLTHIEKELDQINGGMKITIATLGKALAPKIPPMFSDVVLAYRDGSNFFWSTLNSQAIVKNRNLTISDKLQPDFGQIVTKWKARSASASL